MNDAYCKNGKVLHDSISFRVWLFLRLNILKLDFNLVPVQVGKRAAKKVPRSDFDELIFIRTCWYYGTIHLLQAGTMVLYIYSRLVLWYYTFTPGWYYGTIHLLQAGTMVLYIYSRLVLWYYTFTPG